MCLFLAFFGVLARRFCLSVPVSPFPSTVARVVVLVCPVGVSQCQCHACLNCPSLLTRSCSLEVGVEPLASLGCVSGRSGGGARRFWRRLGVWWRLALSESTVDVVAGSTGLGRSVCPLLGLDPSGSASGGCVSHSTGSCRSVVVNVRVKALPGRHSVDPDPEVRVAGPNRSQLSGNRRSLSVSLSHSLTHPRCPLSPCLPLVICPHSLDMPSTQQSIEHPLASSGEEVQHEQAPSPSCSLRRVPACSNLRKLAAGESEEDLPGRGWTEVSEPCHTRG